MNLLEEYLNSRLRCCCGECCKQAIQRLTDLELLAIVSGYSEGEG